METAQGRVPFAKAATIPVGQHVRVSKEKMLFAKAAEQNFRTEIFRVAKVIYRRPRAVYVLQDINGTRIFCQFYREELSPVRINFTTTHKIDKILDKWVGSGIRIRLLGAAGSVKNI